MRNVLLALFLNCIVLPGAGNVYLGRWSGWVQGLAAAPCMALFIAAVGGLLAPPELRLPLPTLSGWVQAAIGVWSAVAAWALADMVVTLLKEAKRCRDSSSQEPTQA